MEKNFKWYETTESQSWIEINVDTLKDLESSRDTLELTGEKYQTVEGFGGCFNELSWIAISKLSEEKKDEILDELFLDEAGCKFNFCRLPIGANDYSAEWYSLSETENDYEMNDFSIGKDYKYLIPYIKEGLKRKPDLKLFASPWSPPIWMKYPKVYNYGTLIWDKKILDAYALYFLKFVEAYEREGIKIAQVHIQNEPMSSQKFPSCIWTGEQFKEFIGEYIGPLFEKNSVDTEIWLGTINGPEIDERKLFTDYDDYANLVLSDEKASKYVKGVAYQWAGKNAVQRTHESWPEIKLMQSENECGDGENSFEYAHYVFRLIRHYFANGINSYIYWNMALEHGGLSTWGWNQNSLVTIDPVINEYVYNPEFYVMKHFSHFVKLGAVRLGTKGHFTGNSLVFENPDGTVVLVINNGFKQERKITLKAKNKEITVILKPYSFNTFVV
ncbi:MAG: glycoside hydrolase family 30 protein [Clostridiaceae bacterium]|nr:glycoside hydrolase family 30 protein [Clostridiaceae bacterium]